MLEVGAGDGSVSLILGIAGAKKVHTLEINELELKAFQDTVGNLRKFRIPQGFIFETHLRDCFDHRLAHMNHEKVDFIYKPLLIIYFTLTALKVLRINSYSNIIKRIKTN